MQEALTTEKIRKQFKNNFDLCNFAISIARNTLLGGNPATLDQILIQVEERASEESARA